MTEKHAAEVLAGFLAGLRSPRCGEAAAMLRTIPALEDELMEQARIVGMGAERELALIAERDALRADFRRLNEKHTNLQMNADACRKERDALRAEVEALRADAERYRWLKERMMGADFAYSESGARVVVFDWPSDVLIGADCDETIDAARKS